MNRSQSLYLGDINDAIEAIDKFTVGMSFEEFKTDDKTFSAVIRKIEIIGEAVKNLSIDVINSNPDIPWSLMARMRDKLIHGYFGIDAVVVWKTINYELPGILPKIKKLHNQIRNNELDIQK